MCSSTPGHRGQSSAFRLAVIDAASFPVGTDQVSAERGNGWCIGPVGLAQACCRGELCCLLIHYFKVR